MIIRDFNINTDLDDLATVHSASKQVAEKGIIFDSDLAVYTPEFYHEKWQEWSKFENTKIKLIYVDDKTAAGFICYGRIRTRPSFDRGVVPKYGAEIFSLYIHPDFIGKGYGKALFTHACQDLTEQKLTSLLLWALKKNKRACEFYEAMGGQKIGKKRIDIGEKSWADESCYGWNDIRKIL